jgi:hypothetical protein
MKLIKSIISLLILYSYAVPRISESCIKTGEVNKVVVHPGRTTHLSFPFTVEKVTTTDSFDYEIEDQSMTLKLKTNDPSNILVFRDALKPIVVDVLPSRHSHQDLVNFKFCLKKIEARAKREIKKLKLIGEGT